MQKINFLHTDHRDIFKYSAKYLPTFFLSYKDTKGCILLEENICIIKYDLKNKNDQYEIPYDDIQEILSEQITYKNKFSCFKFTIVL